MIEYRKDIDSLRALAVIGVLLFHLDLPYITGGFVGVDVFFVISGYLITNILLNALSSNRFSLKDFFISRILRLFPALFAMLFIVLPFAYVFLYQDAFIGFVNDFKYAAIQIANIHFADKLDYFRLDADKSALLHTWSLGVEAQFYLVWPFLLLALRKWISGQKLVYAFIFLGAVSVALGQYLLVSGEGTQAFYMLYSRAYQLIIGAILATPAFTLKFKSEQKPFVFLAGFLMILVSFFAFKHGTLIPGVNGLLPTLGAALIIAARIHEEENALSRIWQSGILVYIGLISYSLYIWHWPLITITKIFTGLSLTPLMMLVLAVASFVMAVLSYHFIEQPGRKIRKQLSNKGKNIVIVVAVGAMAIATIFSDMTYSKLEKYKIDLERDLSASDFIPDHKNKTSRYYGTDGEDTEVVFVGDSHASHYSEAVITWANKKGLSLEIIVRGSCQLIGDVDMQIEERSKCADYIERIKERLRATEPVKYFIAAQRFDALVQGGDPENLSAQTRLIRIENNLPKVMSALEYNYNLLVQNNAEGKFVILGQVPRLQNSPMRCEQKRDLAMTRFFNVEGNCVPYALDIFTQTHVLTPVQASLERFVAEYPSAHLYMPEEAFPLDQVENWGGLYLDDDHLSKEGSLHAGQYFNF